MFCLRCGRPTADDSEFCNNCVEDPVTEQSLEAQAEDKETELREELVVVRHATRKYWTPNQTVRDAESTCPDQHQMCNVTGETKRAVVLHLAAEDGLTFSSRLRRN